MTDLQLEFFQILILSYEFWDVVKKSDESIIP